MKQITLAAAGDQGAGFEKYRKPTRRDAFLAKAAAPEAHDFTNRRVRFA